MQGALGSSLFPDDSFVTNRNQSFFREDSFQASRVAIAESKPGALVRFSYSNVMNILANSVQTHDRIESNGALRKEEASGWPWEQTLCSGQAALLEDLAIVQVSAFFK